MLLRRTILTQLALGVICFGASISWAQVNSPRWNIDPAMSWAVPTGRYNPLPQDQIVETWQNPNTQTRVIITTQGVFAVGPSVRVHPTTHTQSECPMTRQLSNPNFLFGSANCYNVGGPTTFSTGVYLSTDGGTTWRGSDTLGAIFNFGDPAPVIDKDGRMIMVYINSSGGMSAAYSTAFNTWTAVAIPGTGTSTDKELAGTDETAASPFYGRTYTAWTDFTAAPYNIYLSYTSNGGVSWSTTALVSPSPITGHHLQGTDVATGVAGETYVIWANCLTAGQSSTEDSLGFAKSTNGGVSWTISRNNAVDMNGQRLASFGPWGIRMNGFPRIAVDKSGGARNGWIYVVAGEKTGLSNSDVADIFLWKSTNGGTTWSAPVRVNQDAVANGKYQYEPAVCVDNCGGVDVMYCDTRNTTTNDSVQSYLSRSTDGGVTFVDVQVSDHKWRPLPIPGTAGGYQGDYQGIAATATGIYPFWADRSSGIYQVWTARVDYACGGAAPGAPTLLLPVNNAINVSINTPLLDWTDVATATSYRVQVSLDSLFGTTVLDSSGITVSQSIVPSGRLMNNTRYHWRANASNTFGAGPYSTIFHFNTVIAAPGPPVLLLPVNGAVGQSLTPLLDWTDVAGAASYRVQVSIDSLFGTTVWDSSGITVSTATVPAGRLANNVRYYWRANATNAGGTSAYSTVFHFNTLLIGILTYSSEIPKTFNLYNNFPNPFNPETKIRFDLPRFADAKLVVYDVLGREAAVLLNQQLHAGKYEIHFDASFLSSGIYYYRIEAGDFVSTKKMVLAK